MQTIKTERTSVTPEIIFLPAEHRLVVQGECYPENPLPFFSPILAALKAYFATYKPSQFEAEMRLQYINSASTMGLRSLFALLNEAGQRGTDVRVVWAYDAEDDAIEELGTDLVEDFHNVLLEHQPFNNA
jgi:phosphotransferase system HPr-like phosphotransfer protein